MMKHVPQQPEEDAEAFLAAKVAELLDHVPTFQTLHGLENSSLKALACIAQDVYQQGRYADAEKLFAFLCFHNHYEKRYWLALGASRYKLRRYPAAAQAYGYAHLLDTEDPSALTYASAALLPYGTRAQGLPKDQLPAVASSREGSSSQPTHLVSLRQKALYVLKPPRRQQA
jgi:tetratricopeptide (TPR) repeat protein